MTAATLPERLTDFTGWLSDMADQPVDQGTIYSAVDWLMEHDVTRDELLSLYAGDPPSWLLESFWQEFNLWTVFLEWHKRAMPEQHKKKMQVTLDPIIPELDQIKAHFGGGTGRALGLAEELDMQEARPWSDPNDQDWETMTWRERAYQCRRIMKHRVLQLFPEVNREFIAIIECSRLIAMCENDRRKEALRESLKNGGPYMIQDIWFCLGIRMHNLLRANGLRSPYFLGGFPMSAPTAQIVVSPAGRHVELSQTRVAPSWIEVGGGHDHA